MISSWRWVCLGLVTVLGASGAMISACDSSTPTMNNGNDASVQNVVCAQGLTMCNGMCVDVQRDRANCGECNLACNTKASEVCVKGDCVFGCTPPTSKCGDNCVDYNADPGNCGGCGKKCDPGFVCSDGGCSVTCMNGLTACDSDAGLRCTNLQTDDRNCGMCGTKCDPGYLCDQGSCALTCQPGLTICTVPDGGGERCTDTLNDSTNCGGCGKICTNGTFCVPPIPDPDGGDAGPATCQLKCFGGTTKCGNKCADTKIDPNNCGNCGVVCDGGTKCANGMCQ